VIIDCLTDWLGDIGDSHNNMMINSWMQPMANTMIQKNNVSSYAASENDLIWLSL
jgi:hypothetical protein